MRLSEHLTGPGCPLCAARADADVRLVDSLIGEAVNDIGVRRDLDRARGYCARHFVMLPERERRRRGGTLGSAILLGAVLRRRLDRLAELDGGRRLPARITELRQQPDCPLCRGLVSTDGAALAGLAGRLTDPLWAAAIAESDLCLDDFLALWELVARSDRRFQEAWAPVAVAQRRRFEQVVDELNGYIASSGHDRREELTDQQRAAADRAVRLLAGEPAPKDR
jgi:hypothetical protein